MKMRARALEPEEKKLHEAMPGEEQEVPSTQGAH